MKIFENLVVYTCSTNNYDNLTLLQSPVEGLRFIFFTNQLNKVPVGWEGRQLRSPPRLTSGHDINRFHKIFPHHVLPEFRYSVYIDGNISFNGDFGELVEKLRAAKVALAAFSHPEQRKLKEEVSACERYNRFDWYDKKRAKLQYDFYGSERLDLCQLITGNYLLVRDHMHPNFYHCMSIWWSHLFEYTKRDQMSLNYALWKSELPWAFLDEELGVDANLLSRHSRKKSFHIVRKLATQLFKVLRLNRN